MKSLWLAALLCAATLSGATARAAGFEGLRPDPDAPKGQSGRIEALDPEARTFRIGGNTFEVPADIALDFEALHVGDKLVVHYREGGSHHMVTTVEIKKQKKKE